MLLFFLISFVTDYYSMSRRNKPSGNKAKRTEQTSKHPRQALTTVSVGPRKAGRQQRREETKRQERTRSSKQKQRNLDNKTENKGEKKKST